MIRIRIIKRHGTKQYINPPPSIKFARIARGYRPYRSPDLKKHGVNKILEDEFSCKFPDKFYSWYKPTRAYYANQAKIAIRKSLEERIRKGGEKRGRRRKRDKDSDEESN